MRKQTIPEIVEALQQGGMPTLKPNTVYAALRRRESIVGDIVRIGADDWGLKEWIKNAPVPKRAQKTKKAKKRAKAKGKPRPRAEKVSVDASSYASVTTEQEAPAWVDPKSLSGGAGMTIADAAEEILKKAGKPLHLKELAAKLGEYGKRNTTQGLSGNLNQDRLKRLVNLGGNMWALAEWPEEKRKVKAS